MATLAAPGSKPPATTNKQSVPPNQSLYLQNLPEKMQKDELKRELYMLFSTYGPVIDVKALKTPKMRGQAHVLFKDVQTATQAMRQCQSYDFFGREMVCTNRGKHVCCSTDDGMAQKISYSKNRSDTLAKLTGTFNPPTTASQQPKSTAQAPSSFVPPPGVAPPASLPAPVSGLPPPPGLPAKVNGEAPGLKAPENEPEDVASPQGTKRQREDSDDEAPMEEDDDEDDDDDDDDDEGGEMEMSDDDD
jgi:hypothetical protein